MNNNMKRTFATLLVAGCFGAAQAAPTLPQVVSGQATFGQQGNVFTITNTPNAIINWQSFSVNPGEVTRFVQQSADSAVLNRITGQDPSQILGALQSNGQVFLLNPNGIMFGRDARIDVNGLTASTLGLSDADFLAGRRNFSAGAVTGKIANQGAITTPHGGKVYLIAADVENSGIINAPGGEVVLAAGHSVQLVDSANPDLRVMVSAPSGEAVNLGQVVSQGGKIGIYGALVRQRGVVSANSAVRGENGRIILKASGDTLLEAGSSTSATGAGPGGHISVLGERVALTGDARIDASGNQGGGTVLVGGDYQGKNTAVQNARQTWVGKDASIRADAVDTGNGGKVVVWSDDATRAFGTLSARGGALRGDGGMIETSGHYLDVNGARVDAGAAKGERGSWLLDPLNIVVDAGGGQALSDADTFAKNPGETSHIAASLISNATTKVILQATNNINFNNPVGIVSGTGSLLAEAGNAINVNTQISANGGNLEFRAGNSFALGSGGALNTTGQIDIKTDNIVLDGTIGSAAAPQGVSFTPFSVGRAMRISNTKSGDDLSLSPLELNRITTFGINIGSSANTGDLTVSADYAADAGKTAYLALETGGSIRVQGLLDLTANPDSWVILGRYGNTNNRIDVSESGTVKAKSIMVRSDSLDLFGVLNAGPDGKIQVMPHQSGTDISLGDSAYYASGMLGLSNAELGKMTAGSVTIGGNSAQSGDVVVRGAASFANAGTVRLDAGAGNLTINAALTTNGALTLNSASTIKQDSAGIITAPSVDARGGQVELGMSNLVGAVNGAASAGGFWFGSDSALKTGAITAQGGDIILNSRGLLEIDNTINAGSGLADLSGRTITSGASGNVVADRVRLAAITGVGTGSAAIKLRTRQLSVTNADENPSQINVANTGALVLGRVQQTAGGSGVINISTVGTLTVPENDPFSDGARARVSSGGGAIRLASTGAMTIDGIVESASGSIALDAGGLLKIGTPGVVTTNTGNISLTGNRVTSTSLVTAPGGTITITEAGAPPVDPPVVPPVTPVDPTPVPPVDPVPPVPTLAQCVVAPSTPGCSSVLPPLNQCVAAPGTPGCSVVLPSLNQCVAAPSSQGCSAVLPSLNQCVAAPSSQGCTVVLPSLNQCVAAPSSQGCSVVLPSLNQCVAAPSSQGCSVVLPSLNQCVAAPGTPGCSVVLPSLNQCVAAPSSQGCSVVLPSLNQCVAAPSSQGCSAVLPSLNQCVAAPGTPGCLVVLPSLTQCVAAPTLQGCSVMLPSLSQCVLAPTTPGCGVVLPSLSQCVVAPGTAGCSAVLPSLSQCVAAPGTAGCGVVLPSLSQCAAVPTLAGCAVVLPTLAQCAASPGLQGCAVVLPAPSLCIANPAAPGCQAVNPAPTLAVGQNQLATVLQQQTGLGQQAEAPSATPAVPGSAPAGPALPAEPAEEKKDGQADVVATDSSSGAKNEAPRKKTYCN